MIAAPFATAHKIVRYEPLWVPGIVTAHLPHEYEREDHQLDEYTRNSQWICSSHSHVSPPTKKQQNEKRQKNSHSTESHPKGVPENEENQLEHKYIGEVKSCSAVY